MYDVLHLFCVIFSYLKSIWSILFHFEFHGFRWKIKEREGQKAELLANKGSHFHFHGIYADPFEMLAEIERRGHTFTEPDNLFVDCRETGGFVDFHGNRNEASAAFHYRIYDNALVERIRTAVAPIIERGRKR